LNADPDFTSDNGPETLTWPDGGTTPFHGEKGTTWEGGFRVPAIIRWPGKVPPNTVVNDIFDSMDWMPTLVAAAGGPADLSERLREGYLGYKVHLDGFNQMDLILGEGPSKRDEIVYYEGPTLQAIRHGPWKAHFIVQNEGWFGSKEKLTAPILFNLRRDPYEKAEEEAGTYINWMAHKMWAFGPAKRLVEQHLATFEEFPPRRPSPNSNADEIAEQAAEEQGIAQ
jgi:arylsulfatase